MLFKERTSIALEGKDDFWPGFIAIVAGSTSDHDVRHGNGYSVNHEGGPYYLGRTSWQKHLFPADRACGLVGISADEARSRSAKLYAYLESQGLLKEIAEPEMQKCVRLFVEPGKLEAMSNIIDVSLMHQGFSGLKYKGRGETPAAHIDLVMKQDRLTEAEEAFLKRIKDEAMWITSYSVVTLQIYPKPEGAEGLVLDVTFLNAD